MRVIMPVAFKAEHGGLHDHITEIASEALRQSIQVTVAGRAGPFLERLAVAGIDTIEVNLDDIDASCAIVRSHGPWDLIHTHPFEARKFAIEYAARELTPLIATFHGWYADEIDQWHHSADAIIAVTGAIEQRLHSIDGIAHERIHLVENRLKSDAIYTPQSRQERGGTLMLSVASRLDADFAPTLRTVTEFIRRATESATPSGPKWRIAVAGQGAESATIATTLRGLCLQDHSPEIEFLGWLDPASLRNLYARSFATIAPGRAGIDAIASGLPTVLTRQIGTYALAPVGDTSELLYGTYGSTVSGADFYDYCTYLHLNPAVHEQHTETAMNIARSRYNAESLTARLHSIYYSVAHNKRRTDPVAPGKSKTDPSAPFIISASKEGIKVQYALDSSGLEFAFYIFNGAKRTRVEWYSAASTLLVSPDESKSAISVRAFVRDPRGTVSIHHLQLDVE